MLEILNKIRNRDLAICTALLGGFMGARKNYIRIAITNCKKDALQWYNSNHIFKKHFDDLHLVREGLRYVVWVLLEESTQVG